MDKIPDFAQNMIKECKFAPKIKKYLQKAGFL